MLQAKNLQNPRTLQTDNHVKIFMDLTSDLDVSYVHVQTKRQGYRYSAAELVGYYYVYAAVNINFHCHLKAS